jgi:hypothetical protein
MKGKISIMDPSGHSTVEFDTDTDVAVKEAQRIVWEHQRKGAALFNVPAAGATPEQVKVFDPLVMLHVVLRPQMAGG